MSSPPTLSINQLMTWNLHSDSMYLTIMSYEKHTYNIPICTCIFVTFRFMHISSGDTQSATQPSTLPRHMVQLTLSLKLGSKTQAIHQAMEAEFSKKEKWSKIERDVHKLENTQMYKHQSVEQLAVGVKLSGSGMALISTKYHVKVVLYFVDH